MYKSKIKLSIITKPNLATICTNCDYGCLSCTSRCTSGCAADCFDGPGPIVYVEQNK